MNKYFSRNSIIFTITSIVFVILGNSFLLVLLMFFAMYTILLKANLPKKEKNTIFLWMAWGGLIGGIVLWWIFAGLILFGCWIYIVRKSYFA